MLPVSAVTSRRPGPSAHRPAAGGGQPADASRYRVGGTMPRDTACPGPVAQDRKLKAVR